MTTGKGFGRIYKYDQWNWPYPPPNTTFFITKCSDTSIQTQQSSASYAYVVAHALASSGLYQIKNRHGNTDVNDNDGP